MKPQGLEAVSCYYSVGVRGGCPATTVRGKMFRCGCAGQESGGKSKKKAMELTPAQEDAVYAVTTCLKVLTVNSACAYRLARSGCAGLLVKLLECSHLVSRRAARTILGVPSRTSQYQQSRVLQSYC